MKILKKNLKKGEIKIRIENMDDLWYLSQIIEEGDCVFGETTRKIDYSGEGEKGRTERKKVFLKIEVEKTEFNDASVLRVIGKVIEGPEEVGKNAYHSFELREGTKISVWKAKWLSYHLKWLKDAATNKQSKILICVMDRESASFALSKKEGYKILSNMEGEVQKKEERNRAKGDFYGEIKGILEDYNKRYSPSHIVVASPAFFKDDLMKRLEDDLKKKIILAGCSNTGKNGVNEVLKRSEIDKIIEKDRVSKEINVVEKLLEEVSKSGKAAYGLKEVKKAVEAGAVETLLITDEKIKEARQKEQFSDIDEMMKNVESCSGEIHIISSSHEGGKKLGGLGGIAAILRYKMSY